MGFARSICNTNAKLAITINKTLIKEFDCMKRALRIFICCLVSFIAVYLSGYGNLMNDISESLAVIIKNVVTLQSVSTKTETSSLKD